MPGSWQMFVILAIDIRKTKMHFSQACVKENTTGMDNERSLHATSTVQGHGVWTFCVRLLPWLTVLYYTLPFVNCPFFTLEGCYVGSQLTRNVRILTGSQQSLTKSFLSGLDPEELGMRTTKFIGLKIAEQSSSTVTIDLVNQGLNQLSIHTAPAPKIESR